MKSCNKCKEYKSLEDFHNSTESKDGKYSICKICKRAATAIWNKNNAEHVRQYTKAHYLLRADVQKLRSKIKYHSDVEKGRLVCKKYRENNKPRIYARNAARRAFQLAAIPSWSDTNYINIFYQMAKEEKLRTNREVHVDHIVPLQSKLVCGLHCEDNLQLLFIEDNITKGNRTWPDMWETL